MAEQPPAAHGGQRDQRHESRPQRRSQLSILDGWWIEGFNGKNGWAFGEEAVTGDRNQTDAEALYGILENRIIPLYYKMSEDGVPHEWVKVMKESIKSTAARFSARRMVKEYTRRFYAKALGEARADEQKTSG